MSLNFTALFMNTDSEKRINTSFESLDILIGKWRDGTLHEIIDDWKWILSYSKRYKSIIAFYLVLGIISTTLGLVGAVAGKYMIDIITGYDTSRLWILVAVFVGSSVFGLVVGSFLNRLNTKLGIYINNDIQKDIFDKIIDADWLAINKYPSGDVLNRFTGDIGTVSGNAIAWLPTIVISVYQFVATFLVIMHYDLVMAILAFVGAPFLMLVGRYVVRKQREYGKRVREMSSEMMTFEVETFYNFDTIKSFGVASQYSDKLSWWQRRFRDISLDFNMFQIKTNVYLSIVGLLVQFLAFGYCLWRLWTHAITFGTMTLFLQQRAALSGSFNGLIGLIPGFLTSSISAHRVRELVELPKEEHVAQSSDIDRYAADGFTISMSSVDFGYLPSQEVITKSDFVARPGEIVALVGPSGEGKTTMLRIILGLIHPQSGDAVISSSDGTAVRLNADTRHLFSYVPQGNTILSGTIAENMRMANPKATDDEVEEALRLACAWEFVEKLPQTFNSTIGERGRGFSEGQVQRIAIARALLRNAPILLLDEATSALDVATERRVLRNIMQQRPNKTCIVTTHRPTVLNMCSRVYRVMATTVTELSQKQASRMAIDF